MNICELWREMGVGQEAVSVDLDVTIVKRDYGLCYYNKNGDEYLIELDANVLCEDNWEIRRELLLFEDALKKVRENIGFVMVSVTDPERKEFNYGGINYALVRGGIKGNPLEDKWFVRRASSHSF